MIQAKIADISYYLPQQTLDNHELAKLFPEWSAEQIEAKTGIRVRHIAAPDETASDLAFHAAKALFQKGEWNPADIDFLILCTESPDYILPPSATILQSRLEIPKTAGAFDFNLACSGYVYGLSIAKGLIESGAAKNILFLTAETYSKFMHPMDKSVRTLFGDAGTATLICAVECDSDTPPFIGPFVFGTDGSEAQSLMVKTGGMKHQRVAENTTSADSATNLKLSDNYLFMDGPSIFSFTLKVVPPALKALLQKSQLQMDEIELFVFHQANLFMLEALRKQNRIPQERFFTNLVDKGNTVSCTIPIALDDARKAGRIPPMGTIMLVGFGVGLSWAATIVRLSNDFTQSK